MSDGESGQADAVSYGSSTWRLTGGARSNCLIDNRSENQERRA